MYKRQHQADREALESTLMVVLIALGQSLLGAPLCSALNLPQQTAREIAERMLKDSLVRAGRTAV